MPHPFKPTTARLLSQAVASVPLTLTLGVPAQAPESAAAAPSRRQQACAAQHFGAWCCEPRWMAQAVEAIRTGMWRASYGDDDDAAGEDDPYCLTPDGVAVIDMSGHMTKHRSSFGGCSTVETKVALRRAAKDARVKGAVLKIDSPGGTVAGTAELAAEVRAFRAAGKFINAHADDMCCSAAYWVASQCNKITANEGAIVGSIGTYCVLEDTTGMQDKAGVRLRVVSTGAFKGLGADGAVSDALVADVQREVDELNQPFLAAVATGRKTDAETVAKWADGRSHGAAQAKALGLIDFVCTFDDAIGFATQSQEVPMGLTSTPGKPGPVAGRTARAADEETPTDAPAPADAPAVDAESADYKAGYDAGYAKGLEDGKAEAPAAEDAPDDDGEKKDDEAAPAAAALPALIAACDGDKAVAADYFIAGMSAAQARAAYGAVKAANAKAAAAVKDADRARFEAGGARAVATTGGGKAPAVPSSDPESAARAEWSANADDCQSRFVSEGVYVAYRKRELSRIAG